MAKNIVILGGGVGGTLVANLLARHKQRDIQNGEFNITLLSNMKEHIYQPGYLFISVNMEKADHYIREEKSLLLPEVKLIIDTAMYIEQKEKYVKTQSGNKYYYDYLVIATGSIPRPDLVTNLKEAAYDFYTYEGALKLRDKLLEFKQGKILFSVDIPHKCPVGVFELMFILDDLYRMKGIREQIDIAYTYPINDYFINPAFAKWVKPVLEKKGIKSYLDFSPKEVNDQKKIVISKNNQEVEYDLLISIPAHRGAEVITNSNMGDELGFIPVNQLTLKMIGNDSIYVLGDATSLKISKAGSVAHYQAEIVAKNIEAELDDLIPTYYYNGKTFCFVETKLNEATYIEMDYQNPPYPVPPSNLIHWFKLSFNEMYWMTVKGLI